MQTRKNALHLEQIVERKRMNKRVIDSCVRDNMARNIQSDEINRER